MGTMRSDDISEALVQLSVALLDSPGLRLAQLLNIMTTDVSAPGLMTDEELLERLERWNEWHDAWEEST